MGIYADMTPLYVSRAMTTDHRSRVASKYTSATSSGLQLCNGK
jgi:hypothetical protein